jgi:type IV secretory pathway VirJ component
MKRVLMFAALILFTAGSAHATEEQLKFGRFGQVTVYYNTPAPSHVVLFVSGDGGWNLGVVDMARELTTLDALVVGIDITHYLRELESSSESCSYPAADFEMLSKYIQKKYNLKKYVEPVLVGYSSGATLVYAILVQSPPNTFKGGISMGFCPDLPLTKPMCKGSGLEYKPNPDPKEKGVIFDPAPKISAPWIAFQGTIDQVCSTPDTEKYVKLVGGGQTVVLPKVGHGFSVQKNWMPQFRDSFKTIVAMPDPLPAASEPALSDLPLVEVPAQGQASDLMAVIVSGDGGWAGIDRQIGDYLAGKGVSVVGFNSLQYFWTRRAPEEAGKDLARVIAHYLKAWNKDQVMLIGYSLGADVLPFMADRLPAELKARVKLIALLGLDSKVDFEFHLTDWVGGADPDTALPVKPEVEKLQGTRVLCFYGQEESDSLCRQLKPGEAKVIGLEGGHHFNSDYAGIADRIIKEAREESGEPQKMVP